MSGPRRATIHLDPELHRALRIKAAGTDQSISDLVNATVRQKLAEDAEDLTVFRARVKEPNLDFETVVKDLRRRGNYKRLIKRPAVKELEALPRKDRSRLVTRIRSLSKHPRPAGCEQLTGHDLYRIHQGDYRVLHTIQDADLVVPVIRLGHRRDVYR